MPEKELVFKTGHIRPIKRHKIDPNKIKTIDDVIDILKRVEMHVDDEGLKGIEHLIVENND